MVPVILEKTLNQFISIPLQNPTMKNRLNVIVLMLEILAITVLHAAKLHHAETDVNKMSIRSGMEKPDLSFKKTFVSFASKSN